jgi:hypothetical protein
MIFMRNRRRGLVAWVTAVVAVLSGGLPAPGQEAGHAYRHDWYVLGPFANEPGKGFEKEHGPERKIDLNGWYSGLGGKTFRWRHVAASGGTGAGAVNLRGILGEKGRVCAYACTTIRCRRRRRVRVLVGADGMLAMWVRGKRMFSRPKAERARPDAHEVDVELPEGDSVVLLKFCQDTAGPWGFYFRLAPTATEGTARYALENEAMRLVFDHLGRPVEIHNKAASAACLAPPAERVARPPFVVEAYSRNRPIYLKDALLRESGGFCLADPSLLLSTRSSGDLRRVTVEAWRTPEVSLAEAGGTRTLTCRYALAGGIRVTTTVSLAPGRGASRWRADVDNTALVKPRYQMRVYRVLYPILPNLRIGERAADNVLARTYVQGELIPNPSQHTFRRPGMSGCPTNVLTYPGWASMPWMDLYRTPPAPAPGAKAGKGGGLYFASYDPTFQQVDIEAVPDRKRKTVALAMRTLAFLEPGRRWRSQAFVVATHPGDWHWAADRYRADSAAWFKNRDVPAWVRDCHGWFGTGGPNYRYSDLPVMLEDARWLGLNYLQCWSEMLENVGPNKARKSYYCFFLPDPDRGGEKGMTAGVRKVREMGGHVGFYSNFWTWDADVGNCLRQWKEHIPADVKIPHWEEFRKYMSVFPDGHMEAGDYYEGYSGSCPGAKGWRDYLKFWIADKYVKQYGVDAWYIDSFPVTMFGAARVCFSPHHGSRGPHGVGPGLVEFLRELRAATNPTVKLAITSESAGDAFLHYNSHALGLELIKGLTEYQSPQVYTYTFPHHVIFSGSCNGAGSGLKYYYKDLDPKKSPARSETFNRVFLMGYRFDILGHKLNRKNSDMIYLRSLIALREKVRAWWYRSSFRDEVGLGRLPENVHAKVFRHDKGTSVTVALVDRRKVKDALTVSIDTAALELGGLGTAALFTLDGRRTELKVQRAGGKSSVAVPARKADPAVIVLEQ